ncbi:MAG: elongation factor 1-beta [Candidatus Hadarchaeales archaeon]
MGQVAVIFRVMPEGTEVDLKRLEGEIRKLPEVRDVQKYPIAFGLVALRVLAVVPDSEGGSEKVERALSSLEGVSSVQVEGITLI